MKKFLVAVDFTPVSKKALACAVNFAEPINAEITLIFVIPSTDLRYALAEGIRTDFQSSLELRKKVKDYIAKKFANLLRTTTYQRITTLTLRGEPWIEVTQTAKKLRADLIIAGTRGRRPTTNLLLGSTAQQLIRTAPCPVVVVRA